MKSLKLDIVKEAIKLRREVALLTYDNDLLSQKDRNYQKLKERHKELLEKNKISERSLYKYKKVSKNIIELLEACEDIGMDGASVKELLEMLMDLEK